MRFLGHSVALAFVAMVITYFFCMVGNVHALIIPSQKLAAYSMNAKSALSSLRNIHLQMVDKNVPPEKRKYYIVKPYKKMNEKVDFFKGLGNILSGRGWQGKEVITKETLTKMGLNCLLAYGFVSNFSYVTCMIIAWVMHGKKYNTSPLAPGQWKIFLLVYSGLWAANNILRPARFSLSLIMTPAFDRAIAFIKKNTGLSQTKATALLVFLVNFCGTTGYLVLGLIFATKIARVPLLP